MKRQPFGDYEISTTLEEQVRAFVPPRIQPLPDLQFSTGTKGALDRALLSLGRLDGAAATMPDVDLLLYTFVRKEAVLSSQIEGTRSTLDDLLAHEIDEVPGVPIEDIREVSRYVDALGYGMRRLAEGFPSRQSTLARDARHPAR